MWLGISGPLCEREGCGEDGPAKWARTVREGDAVSRWRGGAAGRRAVRAGVKAEWPAGSRGGGGLGCCAGSARWATGRAKPTREKKRGGNAGLTGPRGKKKERAAGWAKGIGLLRFLSFSKSNSISYFYFQLKQIYLNSNKNLNSTTLCTQAK